MNKQYRKAYGNVLGCNKCAFFDHFTKATTQKPEQPSKTVLSQVSVTVIPMNVIHSKN